MKPFLTYLERLLSPFFAELPPLPPRARGHLVSFMPALAIALGVIQLFSVWSLWQVGHEVSEFVRYTNELSQVYGGQVAVPQLSFFYWLDLVLLITDGIILLLAASGLHSRRKEGWQLLLLGTVVYCAYGIIALLDTSHGGLFKFFVVLLGTIVGLYFLFQLREYYSGQHHRPERHLPHPGRSHTPSDKFKH